MIGQTISHYQVVRKLGGGGMGVVYQAEDLNLHRQVAIKILPEELSRDSDALERFRREACSASALNHPNIVTIYELGQVDSTHFIAMELVEGKALRELLACGPLPMRKILQIAAQVAVGLAEAHEAGIVHRDLKPENLMVTPDGVVKIVDFGLAKLAATPSGQPEGPTIAVFRTLPGMILGTIVYMSPEQASGRPADFRSDQFSLGLVLYEMVTGRRAFQRSTEPETLTAILREEPAPIASLSGEVPAPFCWVIERCLAKDPEKRYFSTRDLARDLAAIRDRISDFSLKHLETRPSNLPMQRTAFVGRDREVAAARELLRRPDVRLVTVTGPGGIGKTRLALQLAGDMAEQFPAGVYFVSLAVVNDAELIAPLIAQTLGVRESGGQSALEALQEYLQNSLRAPMLLLLDNFEHLLAAAPILAELLVAGSRLKMLVTSRAALHIYGEHEFPVPPLALPDPLSLLPLSALSQYSAVALFLQRAKAVKPDFEINEDNAAAVAEICRRLDGLPLAIELAAARIKLLSPSAMQTRLASRLQLLTGGARDLPARQQTLRGAIDWSYNLLNAAEQMLFRRLAVFVGGCTLEAAEAVCNAKRDLELDVLEGIASVVDKSLLRQVETPAGEPRFVMLDTVREYGLERLAASGEEALTRRAHAAYCLVLAEEGAADIDTAQRSAWLDRFEAEHDNFRAALEWLTATTNADWGLRLGTALFRFWETREYLGEGRDRLGKLLKMTTAADRTKARARALFAAGVLAGEQGDYASADILIQESLEIARELEDKRGIAVALNAGAAYARDRGEVATSCALFEESLVVWRDLRDPVAVARCLSNLANVHKLQGEYARASSLYQESLSIFRGLADRTGVAWSLNYLGDVAHEQADAADARSFYEQSLALFRELGDRRGIAGALADLGNLARGQKDYEGAHALYRESLSMFRELGHKRGVARLLECFACSAAEQSQSERCLRMAGAAAALRQSVGAPLSPSEQAALDRRIEAARCALANSVGATAWLEGWSLPLERVIDEALAPAYIPCAGPPPTGFMAAG